MADSMAILRFILLLIFACFLANCGANITPPLLAQGEISTKIAQAEPDSSGPVSSEAKKPSLRSSRPKPTARSTALNRTTPNVGSSEPTPKSKPKPSTASTASDNRSLYPTTPNIGSPEWKKEQTQNELKEQHLKRVIEGICSSC